MSKQPTNVSKLHFVSSRFGANNPNWKGGRFVTRRGYVFVYVGRQYHLSNSSGYAAEHRVVMEEMLGRRLKVGEIVHHRDGNKSNNAHENLEVCANAAEHNFKHRSPNNAYRKPGEPNEIVKCECGCGERFERFNSWGYSRRFVRGHNSKARRV